MEQDREKKRSAPIVNPAEGDSHCRCKNRPVKPFSVRRHMDQSENDRRCPKSRFVIKPAAKEDLFTDSAHQCDDGDLSGGHVAEDSLQIASTMLKTAEFGVSQAAEQMDDCDEPYGHQQSEEPILAGKCQRVRGEGFLSPLDQSDPDNSHQQIKKADESGGTHCRISWPRRGANSGRII